MTQFIENACSPAEELMDAILGNVSTDHVQNPLESGMLAEAAKEVRICLPSFHEFIEEIPSPQVICNESLFSQRQGPFALCTESEEDSDQGQGEKGYQQQRQEDKDRKKQKNSNAIKKIGRIILDNLREYGQPKANPGVDAMLKLLSRDSKVGRTEVNKRDKFNTFHLRALLGGRGETSISNLRITRRILSLYLRNNVLFSRQISTDNKKLYLNTMKCSALRCLHQTLAVRLQMSQ